MLAYTATANIYTWIIFKLSIDNKSIVKLSRPLQVIKASSSYLKSFTSSGHLQVIGTSSYLRHRRNLQWCLPLIMIIFDNAILSLIL